MKLRVVQPLLGQPLEALGLWEVICARDEQGRQGRGRQPAAAALSRYSGLAVAFHARAGCVCTAPART